MTASSTALHAPQAGSFAPRHRWDSNFFLLLVGLIWIGVLVGFGWDVIDHLHKHEPNWPIIVHLHAAVMLSWLGVLTTQVLLIRSRRLNLHRKLGLAGAILAGIVIVVGLANSIFMDHYHLGAKDADPSFLSIQLVDLVVFTALAGSGLLLRARDAAGHKRLMLMSTIQISDAGFTRWVGFVFPSLFGAHFWPDLVGFYLPIDALVLGLGAYDYATRGRLHPAYVLGALGMFAVQLTGIWLYVTPAWKPIALKLIDG